MINLGGGIYVRRVITVEKHSSDSTQCTNLDAIHLRGTFSIFYINHCYYVPTLQ